MKCPKCGNEIENTANFCPKCGKELTVEQFFGNDNEPNIKPKEPVNQSTSTEPTPNSVNQNPTQFQQPQNPPYYPSQPYYPPQPTPPPYQQQQLYYPAQTTPTTPPKKNGMAIAGFVCSFFIPLLGWIFGGIGLSRSQKLDGKGKGFSIAAIAIATVMFLINLSTY